MKPSQTFNTSHITNTMATTPWPVFSHLSAPMAAGRETGAAAVAAVVKWSPQPGDWSCAICSNINFHWRDTCNRCHTQRSDWPKTPALFTASEPPTYQLQDSAPKKPFKILKDDWLCPNKECNNINFGRRTTCNRCDAPKPSLSTNHTAAGNPY
jgi:rubredoxin